MIPLDKRLHALAGASIAALCSLVGWPAGVALGAVYAAAVGKEIVDEVRYGGFDALDAAATIGAGAGTWLALEAVKPYFA